MIQIRSFIIMTTCIIASLFFTWANYAYAQSLTYQVHVDKNKPFQAKIVADTSLLGAFEILPARSMFHNKKIEIFCDNKEGVLLDKPLSLQCKQIIWNINFKAYNSKNEDISQQNNLFIARPNSEPLWILNEWDILPRVKNINQISVCIDNKKMMRCLPLPSEKQPPLIMPFGHQIGKYNLNKFEIHLFGEIDIQDKQGLLEKYNSIVDYLASAIPSKSENKTWNLIWLPIETSSGFMGGGAGHNSFMANYPVENGQWTKLSEERLLKVSAHETVHALTRLNNPLWLEESLAEYYAYKAMTKIGMSISNPLQNFLKNKLKIPHANKGLYFAQEQMSKPQKDMTFYPSVYQKGSAFWYEVDTALQAQGKKLDDYLNLLEGIIFHEGKLPPVFENALKAGMSVPVWEKIKQNYLID